MPPVNHTIVHHELMYIFGETGTTNNIPAMQFWVSDGTVDGTTLIRDIGFGNIDHAIINDLVYFNTSGARNMIRSDGTMCGTFEIESGVRNAYPLEAIGNDMIFGAFTPTTGTEPYVYRNITGAPEGGACAPADIATTAMPEDARILHPYPNPFTSGFTLRIEGASEGPAMVAVYTTSGLPIERMENISADTDYPNIGTRWQKGIYVVKVYRAGKLTMHMIVKK